MQLVALEVEVKARRGQASGADFAKLAEMQKKVNDEGYVKALKGAQAGAPLTQVVAAFNQGGEVKIDPASIVDDRLVDRGGGVKSRLITMKGPDGRSQTIDVLAELEMLDSSAVDKVYQRAHTINQDRRGAAPDARGAAAEARAGRLAAARAESQDRSGTGSLRLRAQRSE